MTKDKIAMPITHYKLINCLNALGYQADKGGVCFGVSHMGMQAFLGGDAYFDTFIKRLKYLGDVSVSHEKLKDIIANAKKTWLDRIRNIKTEMGPARPLTAQEENQLLTKDEVKRMLNAVEEYVKEKYVKINLPVQGQPSVQAQSYEIKCREQLLFDALLRDDMEEYVKAKLLMETHTNEINRRKQLLFDALVQEKIDQARSELPDKTRIILELEAFCDSLMLYQDSDEFPQYFEKHTLQSAELVIPLLTPLEKQGGISLVANAFSGAYTQSELFDYFNELQKVIDADPTKANERIVLVLHNGWHTINVGYDADSNSWYLCDANKLSLLTTPIQNIEDLATQVKNSLTRNEYTIFTTQCYSTKNDEKIVSGWIEKWKAQKKWQEIHDANNSIKATFCDSNDNIWLHFAVNINDITTVEKLIKNGTRVNQSDKESVTPLLIAAQNGHLECVQALLENGADVNKPNKNSATPLNIAVQNGHFKCVQALLQKKGVDVDKPDKYDATPLFIAAQNGNFECLQALLEKNADVDKPDKDGATPLFIAAQNGNLECLQALLEKNADVNKPNKDGITPLFIAAQKGHIECVQALLEKNADVNKPHKNGATPLFIAAQNRHMVIVKLLLEKNADAKLSFKSNIEKLRAFAKSENVEAKMEEFIKNYTSQKQKENKSSYLFSIFSSANQEITITPAQIAEIMGHKEIVELIQNGVSARPGLSKG